MMCERDDVQEYILSQTEIEAPEIQIRFSLTYSEMKAIIARLEKCKAIEFVSGVTYKVNPEIATIEVQPYVPKNDREKLYIRIMWECIRLGKTSISPMDIRVQCDFSDIMDAHRWMEQNHFLTRPVERQVTLSAEEFVKKFGEEYCHNIVGDPIHRWGINHHNSHRDTVFEHLRSLREKLDQVHNKKEDKDDEDNDDIDDIDDLDDLDDLDNLDNEDTWDDDEKEDKHDKDDDDIDDFLDKFHLDDDLDVDSKEDDGILDSEKILRPNYVDVKNNARFAVLESIIREVQYQDGEEKCVLEIDGEGKLKFELVNDYNSVKISDGGKTLEETEKTYRKITNALKAFAPVELDGNEITITVDKESNILAALLKLYSAIDAIKKLK